MVTLIALKCSGAATTVGSLVAATTVRVIAGGAGVVCAAAGAARDAALSNTAPKILTCMIISCHSGQCTAGPTSWLRVSRKPRWLATRSRALRWRPPRPLAGWATTFKPHLPAVLPFCLRSLFIFAGLWHGENDEAKREGGNHCENGKGRAVSAPNDHCACRDIA